jgi:surface protein
MQGGTVVLAKAARKLKFRWANITVDVSDNKILLAGESAFDLKAAVTVDGVTYPIMFGGVQTKNFAPDAEYTSDWVNLPSVFPAGTTISLRWLVKYATTPAYWPCGVRVNSDGWNFFSDAVTDSVNDTEWFYARQTNFFAVPPIGIYTEGLPFGFEILGDSISVDGSNDGWLYNQGYPQRALSSASMPWVNNGASGYSMINHIVDWGATAEQRARRRLASAVGVKYCLCALGVNDFSSGRTASNLQDDYLALKAEYDAVGIKLIPVTLLPNTDAGNTAPSANASKVATFNAWLRLNNGVGYGYFDANAVARDSVSTNLWRTDLGTPTTDGIHPEAVIHDALTDALDDKISDIIDESPDTDFVTVWRTTAAGETITLPLFNQAGTWDFDVNWGDGTTSNITAYNDAARIHEYEDAGDYEVRISGSLPGWSFNNVGDKLKIREIKNWGVVDFKYIASGFYGCSNMICTATDSLDLSGLSSMATMFRDCFAFNGDISSWDTSSVANMTAVFRTCVAFNGDISSWDTSSVTTMSSMLRTCPAFKGDISSWDYASVTNFISFLLSSNINTTGTTTNYDNLLIAIEAQNSRSGLTFHGGTSKYSDTGQVARDALLARGWTITDGGHI